MTETKKYQLTLSEEAATQLVYMVRMGLTGFCFFSDLMEGAHEERQKSIIMAMSAATNILEKNDMLSAANYEFEAAIVTLEKELGIQHKK